MIIETIKLNEMNVFVEFFLGISILYLMVYGLFLSSSSNGFPLIQSSVINLAVLVLLMSCCILWVDSIYCVKMISFSKTIVNDYLSFTSKFMIGIFSIVCLLLIKQYLISQKINSFEYVIILLFAILGLFLLCSSNDFVTIYLALELQSLSFYLLSAFKKKSYYSVESGLKYFILGSFSSGLFLFGTSFIYGALGTLNLTDLKELYVSKIHLDYRDYLEDLFYYTTDFFSGTESKYVCIDYEMLNLPYASIDACCHEGPNFELFINTYNFVSIGLLFVFVSLFFKLALAPFHLWSPDIYENSPTSSAFFFAVVPKIAVLVVIMRFSFYGFYEGTLWFEEIVVLLSVISIAVGSLGGLQQRKFKSLLAYSSIGHMGYLLMALFSGSFEGFQMLFCYLAIYAGSGLCIWSIFMFLRLKKTKDKKQNKDLADFILLRKSNFMLAVILTTALLSIAGLPPLIGFLVKLNVFTIAIEKTYYFVALFSMMFSVISTFFYLRIVKILSFEPGLVGRLYYPIKSVKIVFVVFLFYSFIFVFINPSMLYLIGQKISLLLAN